MQRRYRRRHPHRCRDACQTGGRRGQYGEAGGWRRHFRQDCRPRSREWIKATLYKRKARHGGMEVSSARRLRTVEAENAKLKRLLVEAMLDNAALKDMASGKF